MSRNAFYERDMGFDKFMANMKVNSGELSVFVGWLRSSGVYKAKGKAKGGMRLAQIAAIMEFGTKDGRVPERAALRSMLAQNRDAIKKLCAKLILQIVGGKMDQKKALGVLGQFLVDKTRATIAQGLPPPNAASTVRRKGSNKPLIDTGQLIGAVEYEIQGGKA